MSDQIQTINIDPSGDLKIEGVRKGHSWKVELQYFEDDGVTPKNWPTDISVSIWGNAAHTLPLALLTTVSGVVIDPLDGSKLSFGQTKDHNLAIGLVEFSIDADIDAETSATLVKGFIHINAGR